MPGHEVSLLASPTVPSAQRGIESHAKLTRLYHFWYLIEIDMLPRDERSTNKRDGFELGYLSVRADQPPAPLTASGSSVQDDVGALLVGAREGRAPGPPLHGTSHVSAETSKGEIRPAIPLI